MEHIERARVVGRDLAEIHGVDVEKVDFALATHDLARALSSEQLLAEAKRRKLELTLLETREPILIHGALAALWLEHEEGISDRDVLEAVQWHTTGTAGMSQIAMAVFLADKLDPDKLRYYPFQEELKNLAYENLDQGLLYFLNRQIEYFIANDFLIHPSGIELRNELVLNLESRLTQ